MSVTDVGPDKALVALHASLDTRQRPENVAQLVLHALQCRLSLDERMTFGRAARAARWAGTSSVSDEFARPVEGAREVAAAVRLFHSPAAADADALGRGS